MSSTKQKEDLLRQLDEFKQQYPNLEIIQDTGSGLNFKRREFQSLVDQICENSVTEIVIVHTKTGYAGLDMSYWNKSDLTRIESKMAAEWRREGEQNESEKIIRQ